MGGVFEEAQRELEGVRHRLADRPRQAVVHMLLMALEREEIVSMAYRQAKIAERLCRMSIPDDVRRLIERAVAERRHQRQPDSLNSHRPSPLK